MSKNPGGYILLDGLVSVKVGSNYIFTDESAARLFEAAETGKPIVINHFTDNTTPERPGEVLCGVSGGFVETVVSGVRVRTMICTGVSLVHAENGAVAPLGLTSKLLTVNYDTGKAYLASALTI